ncbi:retinol-binding protein pinta-like [Odontomachus brunneus]|uniref:retinol-binding protein pinta-like n=1 Tax=Odontomachus brunneus TaxID=486640 RepID=UPI0013F1C49C|nr:retinol-binding protein pinta-like [Odontomachus brunneus]
MGMIKLEDITFKEATEVAEGNEQLFEEMIDKLRQWLQQQIHLPQEISNKRLQRTILTSKFNLEKAKKRIDSLYTLRALIPEFFANFDPLGDDITQFHKSLQMTPLPKLTPEKYRVIFVQVWKDASMFSLSNMMKYFYMLMDVRTEEDMVNSDIAIWDCTNFTLAHVLKFTPNLLKKCDLSMEAYGIRYKAIYMINSPSYIDQFVKLIKMFMSPKFYDRIHVFESGIESLKGIIPKSILPADFGGEELSLDTLTDMWCAKLKEKRDWLIEQEKLKANESLRSDGVINPDELFGVAGIFRKLEIE